MDSPYLSFKIPIKCKLESANQRETISVYFDFVHVKFNVCVTVMYFHAPCWHRFVINCFSFQNENRVFSYENISKKSK